MKKLETINRGNSVAFDWTEDSKLMVYVNSQLVHVVRPNWGSPT